MFQIRRSPCVGRWKGWIDGDQKSVASCVKKVEEKRLFVAGSGPIPSGIASKILAGTYQRFATEICCLLQRRVPERSICRNHKIVDSFFRRIC